MKHAVPFAWQSDTHLPHVLLDGGRQSDMFYKAIILLPGV